MRVHVKSAADLLASGRWLPPRAAAAALGCDVDELERHRRNGAIRRRSVAPRCYLYELPAKEES